MRDSPSDVAIDHLVPALIQSFGVILFGYLAGRWEILSSSQAQGLNSYVTKFALPAVFFKVMVTIDFSDVCWYLVTAVSLSKLIAFLLAFIATILLSRKFQFGKAAILSMFVSQSNDVALGYPVLDALFPGLASYVYLFAPAQLAILNPIAYTFLEWHRLVHSPVEIIEYHPSNILSVTRSPSARRCRTLFRVIWRVLLNPIFFMTVIGVAFNFILHHHIPIWVDGLLKIIADSFAATALFTLGFGMVGKVAHITQQEVHILFIILLTKLVILPFVNRELTVQLMPVSWANETLRYSTFAFLYGTIPTAPPVYLFAAEYGVMEVVTGVGLVFGTFLCAPMMFILARTVTMYLAEPSQYDHLLGNTITGVSWLSVAGCILTAAVLFLTRKAFRIPHRFTLCYIGCVLLSCLGIIAGYLLNRRDHTSDLHIWREHALDKPANWLNCLQFTIFFLGCTGARFWMTLIAFSLFLQRFRSVCFVLRHQTWIYLVGFALPAIVTSVLLLASSWHIVNDVDPAFQYGRNQLIIALVVLLLNTFATTFFLIWYIRLGPTTSDKSSLDQRSSPLAQHSESSGEHDSSGSDAASAARLRNDKVSDHQDSGEVHRRSLTSSSNVCSCHCITLESRRQCNRLMTRYERLSHWTPTNRNCAISTTPTETHEYQHQRHVMLILFLLITMFFGICLCTWRLVREAPSGVYLVLEFLDATFNFGQGFAVFILFGLDADLIVFPLKRVIIRYARLLYATVADAAHFSVAALTDTMDAEKTAHQFVTYHLVTCSNCIAVDVVSGTSVIKMFSEDSLKQWLSNSGLVVSDADGAMYINALKSTRVIGEVCPNESIRARHFSDVTSDRLLYFVNVSSVEPETNSV